MAYRTSGGAAREEITELREELGRIRAATAASWVQCRALGARKGEVAAPIVIEVPGADQGASALARETQALRDALAQATIEARRLRGEERRLRASAVRRARSPRDAAHVVVMAGLLVGIGLLLTLIGWAIVRSGSAMVSGHG